MRRVLLVPDRVLVGELRPSYFDRNSLSVRTAGDAAEGLRMAEAFRPDLIVLRSDVGEQGPRAFCDAVRKLLPRVRLMLITEQIGEEIDDVDGLCEARLVQPVDAEQLLATAASLLDVRTRRAPRVPLEALVHMTGFGLGTTDGTCVANAIDVSEHGVLLESSEQLQLGANGTVLFFLPEDSERIAASGTARVAMDEVRLHYAIEFSGIDDGSRALIARYVVSQKAP